MDDEGDVLPAGETGEIVIRGANVTDGYLNNPAANATAFTDGWFRTGDQGVIDDDGYLHLTGRLKEIINRGGEKISPLEVDEVLLDHPAVAQAVAFAVPHAMLGEEVGAAIVLREGAIADAERDPRLRAQPPRRVQGAAPHRVPGGDPQGPDRQDPARRPCRQARPGLTGPGISICDCQFDRKSSLSASRMAARLRLSSTSAIAWRTSSIMWRTWQVASSQSSQR